MLLKLCNIMKKLSVVIFSEEKFGAHFNCIVILTSSL